MLFPIRSSSRSLRGPDHDGDLDGAGAVPAKREENVPPAPRGPGNRRAGTMTGVCSARYRSDSSFTLSGGPAQWQATAWEAQLSRLPLILNRISIIARGSPPASLPSARRKGNPKGVPEEPEPEEDDSRPKSLGSLTS